MTGRSGILSGLSNNTFIDAACGRDKDGSEVMYSITSSGLLCQFSEGRVVQKWINLQVKRAYSICADDRYIACGCENGIIRLFEPETLRYLGTLPRPHQLDVDVTSPGYQPHTEGVYPNVIAVKVTSHSEKIACIYSDRSMFIWDIKNLERVGKYRSFLYHSNCIWNVETYPEVTHLPSSLDSYIPSNSFATCSSDGTIRFWNLEHLYSPSSITSPVVSPTSPGSISSYRGNIYSKELLRMLFIDQYQPVVSENLEDSSTSPRGANTTVIRSIKISADGRYLASGDKEGNLRVHDLLSMEQIVYQEAHNGDILTIDFSNPSTTGLPSMVATAGRDRLIHVFDANNSFTPIQTLDDHSAAITSLKFTDGGGVLISSSADKSIIFRKALPQLDTPFFTSYQNHFAKASVYDMDLDSTKPIIASVTQDKRFHLFGVESGKLEKSHRPESLDENNPDTNILKIALDPSGSFVATCCSDKSIRIFDVHNGNLIAKLYGHSEQVTSIKFSQDCTSLISTAGDGCIFIWSLSLAVTKQMLRNRRLLSPYSDYSTNRGNDMGNTMLQSPPKGLAKVRSMDNMNRDQDTAEMKDMSIMIDPRRVGTLPRRKVSEYNEHENARIHSPEGISKLNHSLNFPGINYTLDSSSVVSSNPPDIDKFPFSKAIKSPSQSSTDDEEIAHGATMESSDDEGCDDIIYLESPDDKLPASTTIEFTIEENKPTDPDQSSVEEEIPEEIQSLEGDVNELEEDEAFVESSGQYLDELFDSAQESNNSKRASHRQSMSAKFLSTSSVTTLKNILENIPEQDATETNVVEAHTKLCSSPIAASPTPSSQKTPYRHWRKRSCSLDFPIDTSDTFQIMTPPQRNKTDQELEHPRRALRNAGLLSVNTSKKDYSPKSLSPIPSPRLRQITPRKISTSSHESARTYRETKDTDDKVDSTTRSLQALSKILHLQRSLSQALDANRYLFQSPPRSSTEDDLTKKVCRGLTSLRGQIDSNLRKQGTKSPKPAATNNALGVLVEDDNSSNDTRYKNIKADEDEISVVESESNWTENTDHEDSAISTPSTPIYPGLTDVLEKYSDLLLKMVEEKMERMKGTTPEEAPAHVSFLTDNHPNDQ
ncbi:hypothetical protein K7432_005252 [Basidiobolus ranarum]